MANIILLEEGIISSMMIDMLQATQIREFFYLLKEGSKEWSDEPLEFKELSLLIRLGSLALNAKNILQLYLTECQRCCSKAASYRLFTQIPEFNANGHPDSGVNGKIIIARTYHQPENLLETLAKGISNNARKVTTNI